MSDDKQAQLLAKWGAKISIMCKRIGGLEEDGENKFSHYKYISSNNLLGEIRFNLSVCELAIIPEIDSYEEENKTDANGKIWTKTTVHMVFEIIDTETGYMRTKKWTGNDQDTTGKSFGQAITECTKRFYFKLFQVSSKEDPDPDDKTTEDPQPDKNQELKDRLKPTFNTEQKKPFDHSKEIPESRDEKGKKEKEPQKQTSSKLGKYALKLAALIEKADEEKPNGYYRTIQNLMKSGELTPAETRTNDELIASNVFDLIEERRGFEIAEEKDPELNQPEKTDEDYFGAEQ